MVAKEVNCSPSRNRYTFGYRLVMASEAFGCYLADGTRFKPAGHQWHEVAPNGTLKYVFHYLIADEYYVVIRHDNRRLTLALPIKGGYVQIRIVGGSYQQWLPIQWR